MPRCGIDCTVWKGTIGYRCDGPEEIPDDFLDRLADIARNVLIAEAIGLAFASSLINQ
jgi:hypothetical protein